MICRPRFVRSALESGLAPSLTGTPLVLLVIGFGMLAGPALAQEEEADPPEVTLGERLFLETRFAEFFASRAAGDVNAPLASGDPVLDQTQTTGDPLPGPFAGQSINCRSCHLVDEQLEELGGGMRTYSDFARRSPVPQRDDGRFATARNSPPLVNASLPGRRGDDPPLHFDGEFASVEDLVSGTLTGRNYGWLPDEGARAVAHIARVIREDDGSGELAAEFGGAYARVFLGADPSLPGDLRLPEALRLDVGSASDEAVLDAVVSLIAAYVRNLVFAEDELGAFSGSPYDRFLERNGLPTRPFPGESDERYTRRLRRAVQRLRRPVFVNDGPFAFHDQDFAFGPLELEGLRVFLREGEGEVRGRARRRSAAGNCAVCHPAPAFTDHSFHNTGVTQIEYDAIHGAGRFASLRIPGLFERWVYPERSLPATAESPDAPEPFRRPASAQDPSRTDLGLWNVFANPALPAPQARLFALLCEARRDGKPRSLARRSRRCAPGALLRSAVARFKTAGLRDLSHSAPYFHNGLFDSLTEVLAFYDESAELARTGRLRNGDPALARIRLGPDGSRAVVAFLLALNEDYE